ncbi:MAG: hypothetical protein K9H61_02375 [Bacteroidia bacterium]|nr:hypothetical protein [Bacteroidia bacterium]MCF8427172.1 hypothetical protein [Bacteroidia bacterium]MCF8445817.1 hypothetical protein [Bacteroidia bacterium]
MKFETKLKLRGGYFSSFYSTIKRAEDYYKCLANSGTDLSRAATNIMVWRVLFGLKQRLETIAIKKQNELVTHINFKLSDVESACLLNAILPPDNNTYNVAVISEIRNEVYKSTSRHIFNLYPNSIPQPAEPNYFKKITPSVQTPGQKISIEDARHNLANFDLYGITYSIKSYISFDNEGRLPVTYQSLDEALEDGRKLEPISIHAEDLGIYVINEN